LSFSSGGFDMKAVLLVHGGAGKLTREVIGSQKEAECKAALEEALRLGHQVLKTGGTSLHAVEAAVRSLEDCPLFNAGRGACFNSEGKHELDACIMDGITRKAGAIAAITNAKNPISVARAVMERSSHVLLSGEGANRFATSNGAELVEQSYFATELQRNYWQNVQTMNSPSPAEKHGTVGAVAVDAHGNLAAATSTGGTVNKLPGRIGDTPIVGAGTYADNLVAASGTGQGEYFIRFAICHEIASMIKYARISLDEAAKQAIRIVQQAGGDGGIIAIDKDGNFSMPFNTEGMYRGYITKDGECRASIFS
jgi:beta-aspartyl-peptidase (threonine type)